MALLTVFILLLAMLVPAPLKEPGNLSQASNSAKAAWFLLWIQELVGHSKHMIYAVLLGGVCFLLLPYLPGSPTATKAEWLPKDQLGVNILTLLVFGLILALTGIAMFLRGENWVFVYPF